MIRWGILGVAGIAVRALVPAIAASDNGVLHAIASREPARARDAARAHGFAKAHDSYAALLDDPDVDAVYIPLPNSMHREWTIRAAEAKKHVLCEKPLGLSAGECREMIAACREHGVALMEAFMYRFHPRTIRAAAMAAAGEIGDHRLVRASFTSALRSERNIRLDPALGGGALWDVGCYCVNVTRMLLGEPEEVSAHAVWGSTGVDEILAGTMRFPAGRLGVFDCGLRAARKQEVEAASAAATLRLPWAFLPGTGDVPIVVARVRDGRTEEQTETIGGADQYRLMVEAFGEAVQAGRPVPYDPEDTVRNHAVIEALYASARSGRSVAPRF
jgi:predicted dehydrogenase